MIVPIVPLQTLVKVVSFGISQIFWIDLSSFLKYIPKRTSSFFPGQFQLEDLRKNNSQDYFDQSFSQHTLFTISLENILLTQHKVFKNTYKNELILNSYWDVKQYELVSSYLRHKQMRTLL